MPTLEERFEKACVEYRKVRAEKEEKTAENIRLTVENKRLNAENARLTAEIERLTAELSRKSDSSKPVSRSKKKPTEKKSKHGEYKHVLLTDTQYNRLKAEFGEKADKYIAKVDEYCQQTGKSYKDYNLTVRKFMREDKGESSAKPDSEHSYDLDKLLNHAIEHIPTIE